MTTEEILCQYYPKYNEQANSIKDILRGGLEQTIVAQVQDQNEVMNLLEIKLRHSSAKKENAIVADEVRKKLKLNDYQAELRCVDTIQEIVVQTDLKYNPKFFLENSFSINKSLEKIKQTMIMKECENKANQLQKQMSMQKNLNIWFEQSQQSKNEEILRQPPQLQKKGLYPSYQLLIKPHESEGLQVSGIITSKLGYKMNYPNLGYTIKATDIPNIETTCSFIKKIKPLNSVDLDQLEDLKRYVWKYKQYIQFFKVLLKVAQGNLEISETLVKTQQRMKVSFYHVMTFYHISNRSWSICRLIKDLNKKGLYARERISLYDTMIDNIQEDLEEIFSPLLIQGDWIPIEEQFISFEQYKKRLQEVILIRENSQ